MDWADPALFVALALGAGVVLIFARLQPKPPAPPRCLACNELLERGEEIADSENPEHRYIAGQREAWFSCPRCGDKRRARY